MEWKIQSQDQDRAAALAAALGVHPVVAWLLLNRGIGEPDAAKRFLAPSLDQLKPGQWPADMDKAVNRLEIALERGETIGIHGDYDVDGITGAALLHLFFKELGARTEWRLPHRRQEGYGMRPVGMEDLHSRGASLVLAVDCGVSDFEAIVRANELGMDVIVLDHHQPPDPLPPAFAIVDPARADCPFHGEALTGVGVAYYLCIALRSRLREQGRTGLPNLKDYLDLVALGTVADVAPLRGLNRALVRFGLEKIAEAKRPGIVQLKRVAGVPAGPVGVGQVAFHLAPRLNAAGRLESAEAALKMLIATSEREAGLAADELEKMNQRRRQVEERILEEAVKLIESRPGLADGPALVVAGEGWHIGVIGIVASRLTETYYRPACVIGVHQGLGKGSLRSIPGINIHRVLTRLADLLETYGGHPMAAGLSIREENLPRFSEAFLEAVREEAPGHDYRPSLNVDAEWPIHRLDPKLIAALDGLKPHGIGNPAPTFCARGVTVKWSREAKGNTLLMGIEEKGAALTAVGFRLSHRLPEPGTVIDLVYTPVRDEYNGRVQLKVMVKDFRAIN